MKGKPIKAHWFLWVLIGVGFLVSILLYHRLPAQIPMHWNIAGEVNGYGSRFEGAFALPLLNVAILLLLVWLPAIDPRRKSYAQFKRFYRLFQWVMVIFLLGMQGLILAWALGYRLSVALYVKLALGFLFMVLGNYLGEVRPNWFMGIRTPWTLENEEVWVKTHHLAGPLMFGVGVLFLVLAFINHVFAFWLIIAGVMAAALVPVVYSYWLHQKIVKTDNN